MDSLQPAEKTELEIRTEKKKGCILTVMSERMWYSIEMCLSHAGRNTKSAPTSGITTGIPFFFLGDEQRNGVTHSYRRTVRVSATVVLRR
jgi:hypothetical protein